jgi:hypothetical protein
MRPQCESELLSRHNELYNTITSLYIIEIAESLNCVNQNESATRYIS